MTVLDDLPGMLADLPGRPSASSPSSCSRPPPTARPTWSRRGLTGNCAGAGSAADRARSLARANAVNAADREAWRIAMNADYLRADSDCRGELLSRAGKRAADKRAAAGGGQCAARDFAETLWSMDEGEARRLASWELTSGGTRTGGSPTGSGGASRRPDGGKRATRRPPTAFLTSRPHGTRNGPK